MTRDNALQLLPLLTAYARGKTIQNNSTIGWQDDASPFFGVSVEYYRVKPEPRRFWMVLGEGSDCCWKFGSRDAATKCLDQQRLRNAQ